MSQTLETQIDSGVKPHRGGFILGLGFAGLGALVAGLLNVGGILGTVLLLLLAFATALAAMTLGKGDLKAIRGRRMDRSGEIATRIGYLLGLTGTVFLAVQASLLALDQLSGRVLPMFAAPDTSDVREWDKIPRPPKHRMVAAMLVNGEDMWFLKMEGPEDKVAKHVDDFKGLLRSLSFNAKGDLTWKLPPEWQREAGNEFRFATLRASPIIGVSVTKLPKSSPLANVNRWRKQLSLPKIAEEDLPKHTEKIKAADDVEVTLVDITGERSNEPPMAAQQPSEVAFTVPKGWTKVPTQFAFQKASFITAEGDKQARIMVSIATGSVLDNVNRWRQQLGLEKVQQEDLRGMIGKINVAGEETFMFDMTGPQRAGKFNRIIVALHLQGGQIYFYRLDGPDDLVERQKADFEAFLRSVRYEEE